MDDSMGRDLFGPSRECTHSSKYPMLTNATQNLQMGNGLKFPVQNSPTRLGRADFAKYIGDPPTYQIRDKSSPRSYGVFVLFNALEAAVSCPGCK